MDILKRSLAPITSEAWKAIDDYARDVLVSHLSARKFVSVGGPMGWDYAALPLGRLTVPEGQKPEEVRYGVYAVKPLVEARATFMLEVWELDNIIRGAKDITLDSLEDAARKMASFEDAAVYRGLKAGGIAGIYESMEHEPIGFDPGHTSSFLEGLSGAVTRLVDSSVPGPYALVVNCDAWRRLMSATSGYPLTQHIDQVIDGGVVHSHTIEGALVVSKADGNFELVVGQDFSIGYETHDARKATLFVTESFTFRVIEPRAAVQLNPK
jgi:uncharacterized linocin/CFP29 family protein